MKQNSTITAATRSTVLRAAPNSAGAMISASVMAPVSRDSTRRRGAIRNQLIRNPLSVAGNSHSADSPQEYAAPLTASSVQADDELAEPLSAASQGPSRRPPRK